MPSILEKFIGHIIFKAAYILRNEGVMMTKTVQKETVWLNRPDSLDFVGRQLKEPLKITFDENN